MINHTDYMKRCLVLAASARKSGSAAVGSIIVRDGEIISEGIEGASEFPSLVAHAEAIAIQKAVDALDSRDLSACTIYSTVEPCALCSYLIRETRIGHVVYGTEAGRMGGASSKFPLLTFVGAGPWAVTPSVTPGILRTECEALLNSR